MLTVYNTYSIIESSPGEKYIVFLSDFLAATIYFETNAIDLTGAYIQKYCSRSPQNIQVG